MIKRILFASILALISFTLLAQPSAKNSYIDEMLKAADNGDESSVLEYKLLIEAQPRKKHENRIEARKRNNNGLRALNYGDAAEALKEFKVASEMDPADPEIINNVGFALGNLGRYHEAAEHIRSALLISPGRSVTWYNLGEIFSKLDDQKAAESAWRIAYLFSTNKNKTLKFLANAAEDQSLSSKSRKTVISVLNSPEINKKSSDLIEIPENPDVDSKETSTQEQSNSHIENKEDSTSDAETQNLTNDQVVISTVKNVDLISQARPDDDSISVGTPKNISKETNGTIPYDKTDDYFSTLTKARIFKLLLIGAVCSLIGLLFAGATNRIVIFFDWEDLGSTLMIFGSMVAMMILLWIFDGDELMRQIVFVFGLIAMLYFSAKTIISSVRHNRSIPVGVIVGVFKIFVSIILGFLAFGKFFDAIKKTNSLGVRIFAMIALGAIFFVASILVNGERVKERRATN